jgi:hypothetical protein
VITEARSTTVPEVNGMTMALEAHPTPKVPSAPKAIRQTPNMCSDRLMVKCLQVVNICNNPVTMYSAWDPGQLGVVRTMFTDPLTARINRPPWDHPLTARIFRRKWNTQKGMTRRGS